MASNSAANEVSSASTNGQAAAAATTTKAEGAADRLQRIKTLLDCPACTLAIPLVTGEPKSCKYGHLVCNVCFGKLQARAEEIANDPDEPIVFDELGVPVPPTAKCPLCRENLAEPPNRLLYNQLAANLVYDCSDQCGYVSHRLLV
jgi:hypothetical protein